MKKAKKPAIVKPIPSIHPDLFVYYRGQKPDGNIQENNILLHNVAPLVTAQDFAALQGYLCKIEDFVLVRIIYWQRAEGLSCPPVKGKK